MRVTGSRAYTRPTPVPKMPPGLVELMEGMTKEVLRCNPTNVYEFCAAHMHKLLEIRDGPTEKQALKLEQRISKAQAIIKLRAQERQQKYDKEMPLINETVHNNKELSSQIEFVKTPATQGNSSDHLEELEISEKSVTNPTNSKDNEIIQSGLPITKKTLIDQNAHQLINQVENDRKKNIIDAPPTVVIGTSEYTNNSDPNVNNNAVLSESYEEKNDITVIQTTEEETSAVKISKDNEKIQDNVEIAMITKELEPYSTDCSIDNKEFDKNHDDADKNESVFQENKIKEESVNNVAVATEVDLLDDKMDKIPTNKESVPEDKTVDCIINIEPTYDRTKDDNELNYMNKNNENGIESSIKYVNDINSHSTENNGVRIYNDLSDVKNDSHSIFDVTTAPNQNNSIMPALNKDNVTEAKEDHRKNEKSEIGEKFEQSHSNNIILPVTDVSLKNHTEIVPSDDHETNNMDLETAAITIQKVFRSFLFKSRASNDETSSIDEDSKEANGYSSPNSSKERRPLGITRMDTMLQTVNEEKSLSLSTDDSSTLSSAATIIQAHIRGFLVRNKLNSNKTASTNSILNSEDPVTPSPDGEIIQNNNNKTVLNIHIVPEGNIPSLCHDESIATSMDLSLDGSPPSSINLHPLGYDKSEPRKQLKREDAIQSISPPSNNSGKLSEDVDSTKEVLISGAIPNDNNLTCENDHIDKVTIVPDVAVVRNDPDESSEDSATDSVSYSTRKRDSITKISSDEMDVVTPFTSDGNQRLPEPSNSTNLMHSGELHDVVLPTNVSRSSTSVVREFKAVLVYFLIWNK